MAISMPQCHGGADQGNIRASIGSMSTSVIFYFSIVGRERPRFAHNHSEILFRHALGQYSSIRLANPKQG